MQHNVQAQQDKAERRVEQVRVTLVNHNSTVDRVLEACRRIDYRQSQKAQKEIGNEDE